jgi:mRNA-degrading endonuclease RelE of RelBE toxin-antitoxin system
MAFQIAFTQTAAEHLRSYRKFDQQIILDAIEAQLRNEPQVETRNRKLLGENPLSDWELRIGRFRVFFDIVVADEHRVVKIKAVGHKEHNKLLIAGMEVEL